MALHGLPSGASGDSRQLCGGSVPFLYGQDGRSRELGEVSCPLPPLGKMVCV